MAVYVKPNGLFGTAYMAAIRPFRHLIVYPPMMREIGRHWRREHPSDLPGEPRWAVLYDADCGFCMWLLSGLLRWDRKARLHAIPLQRPEADDLLQELTPAERMASWHLISPTGERQSRGAAVPPLLRLLPAGRLPAAGFARFPRLTDRGYRWVAEHRSLLSKLVPSSAKERAGKRVHERELPARARPGDGP
jgi:predicted DCC family thiol-disulfide oxidoreductase YuxK